MRPPTKLYKYCPLGVYSLRAISESEVHHTSPRNFNDPLDCNPTIQIDISDEQLIELATSMMKERLTEAAINDWHVTTQDFLRSQSSLCAEDLEALRREEVLNQIKHLLDLDFGVKGVLSLSENWNEPLLWSHYADQHRGICIEYDTTHAKTKMLGRVDYRAPRALRANDLYQWKVHGNTGAQKRVNDGYFYAKAEDWQYEHEWRDISDRCGVNNLPFKITAIYVGMRSDPVWINLLKPLLRDRSVNLHRILVNDDTFKLASEPLNKKDLADAKLSPPPPSKVSGNIYQALPQTLAASSISELSSMPSLQQHVISSVAKGLEHYGPTLSGLASVLSNTPTVTSSVEDAFKAAMNPKPLTTLDTASIDSLIAASESSTPNINRAALLASSYPTPKKKPT